MEAATGREVHRLTHAGPVLALWFPPDAAYFLTASDASPPQCGAGMPDQLAEVTIG